MNGVGDERLHRFGLSHRQVFGKVRRIQCDTYCFRRTVLNLGNATELPNSDKDPFHFNAGIVSDCFERKRRSSNLSDVGLRFVGQTSKWPIFDPDLRSVPLTRGATGKDQRGSTTQLLEIRGALSSAMRLFGVRYM